MKTRTKRTTVCLLLAATATAASCSSGGSSGTSAGTPTEATFGDAYADGVCGVFDRCCAARALSFDGAACRSMIRSAFVGLFEQAPPNVGFDAASAEECLSLLGTVPCSGPQVKSDACERFINGELAPGSACTDGDECYQDRAAIGAQCLEGTCKRITRVPVGASCAVDAKTEPQCDGEAWCNAGTCAAPVPAGSTCTDDFDCESHACSGVCASKVPNGGPCGLADCQSDRCDTGTQTCVARLPLGATCENRLDCESDACVDGVCVAEPVVGTATQCAGNIDF